MAVDLIFDGGKTLEFGILSAGERQCHTKMNIGRFRSPGWRKRKGRVYVWEVRCTSIPNQKRVTLHLVETLFFVA